MLGYVTGLRALQAARISMDVSGNNIANANTEGYSRQRALAVSSLPFGLGGIGEVGTGVNIQSIDRVVDSVLEGRLLSQTHIASRFSTQFSRTSDLQSHFAEPGESGINQRLADFFGGFSALQSSPDDLAVRGGLLQDSGALTDNLRQLSRSLEDSRDALGDEIVSSINEINDLAQSIAELNNRVAEAEAAGTGANGLRDTRSQWILELSQRVDTNVVELDTGAVNVIVGGHLLVTGNRVSELSVDRRPSGELSIRSGESGREISIQGGAVKGLIDVRENTIPGLSQDIDAMTMAMIQEVNQVHARGLPLTGPFRSLTSDLSVQDQDGDGETLDEVLAFSGLPFEMNQGELLVTVTDLSDDSTQDHRVTIDPENQTVGDLVQALSEVPRVSASVDVQGRLRLQADAGFAFDFAGRPEKFPDSENRFGSSAASLTTLGQEPFELNDGDQFSVSVDGGAPQLVTFQAADFADMAQASADEVATAIRSQLTGAVISADDGLVVLQSATSSGTASTLQITDSIGNPSSALGLSTQLESGGPVSVDVAITGSFEGGVDGPLSFRAERDGEIGITDGLRVSVFDASGERVASLDVGAEYVPGTNLDVGFGLQISFTAGKIGASAGDQFDLDVVSDSDTSRVLSAFQLNAYFTGSSARDIEVSQALLDDPRRLSGSLSGEEGDNGNFVRLEALSRQHLDSLEGASIPDFYGQKLAGLGSEVRRTESVSNSQALILDNLQRRREEVSGVSIDEEVVNLERQQQLYEAAARFIQTLNQTLDTVLNL